MRTVWFVALKDLRLLLRDKAGAFFIFVFPLMFAIFFGTIFSGQGQEENGGIGIAVVDEDGTDGSKEFVAKLQESTELEVTLTDRDSARKLVLKGDRTAYVIVPSGYGEATRRMFWGDPAKLELGVDPSRKAEAAMLQGMLLKVTYERMQARFGDTGFMKQTTSEALEAMEADGTMDPEDQGRFKAFFGALNRFMDQPAGKGEFQGFRPVEIKTAEVTGEKLSGPINPYAISFPQGIIWGIIGCAAGFGISLVTERVRGTLIRLRMSPISRAQILGGKALACFTTTIGVATVLLVVAYVAFGVVPDSVPLLIAAVVSMACCFVGIMMFLSVLGKTEAAAGGIGWAILTVMAMLGGGMIPYFLFPGWMRKVSIISPVKWSIEALEGAIWRNYSVGEMLLPCGILVAIGVVFFWIGTYAFRWTE